MPPRTRASKPTKGLKENIGVVEKTRLKSAGKVTKPTRKALADKTNSASDDNASIEHPKVAKKPQITSKLTNRIDVEIGRPHRDRRLPNRFLENDVLKKLSNSKENVSLTPISKVSKTPQKVAETSLVASRPRRLCCLPSKSEDNFISPNKSITIEPTHSSTPISLNNKNSKISNKLGKSKANEKLLTSKKPATVSKKDNNKTINGETSNKQLKKSPDQNVDSNTSNSSADTNNNARQGRTLPSKRINTRSKGKLAPKDISYSRSLTNVKSDSPKLKNGTSSKKAFRKNRSFRVLDDKSKSGKDDEHNLDVYEFTYDPNEEPPPQKKKRKRAVRKKPVKPKTVVFKSNYDQNLSKALRTLKNVVSHKVNQKITNEVEKSQIIASKPTSSTYVDTVQPSTSGTFKIPEQNHASIQVEDIAADFEVSLDHHEIDYSPINTPNHPQTPIVPKSITEQSIKTPAFITNDPLNLRENNLSFFDDEPVASSSMNMTAKHPHASPWRVEFQTLPIKWHVNSYVKANMTPAMECSFVNFDDNKKKHVYTNMMPEDNDPLPEIVQNDEANLKQTSILSFIKEVMDRSASKKKRDRSTTPNRVNSAHDLTSKAKCSDEVNKTPKKVVTPKKSADRPPLTPINDTVVDNISNEMDNASHDKQNSKETQKRKNDIEPNAVPAKTPRKDKENTFFGFDDSENEHDENISPNEISTRRVRVPRPRAQTVLKAINAQTGPTRAMLPIAANSEAVTKFYEEMKSDTDTPVVPEKSPVENVEATNVNEGLDHETVTVDDETVHLFEDIAVIHHLKPTRKSYGKAKKVAFQQDMSNSDTQDSVMPRAEREDSDEEDDLADLTFEIPTVKEKRVTKKKLTKKQKLSKKEGHQDSNDSWEREADAWAADFNSMCEDIDDFPLVVE